MKSIAEEIVSEISRVCEAKASVRLSAAGGTAFYPISDRLKVSFLDKGELREMTVRVKMKGEVPSVIFAAAEKFCSDIGSFGDIVGENFRVVGVVPSERPSMESCAENGMSIVSFALTAEYILERGQALQ
ncbi:MAG: hypothetical protein ACI4YB_06255 [Oscillospiraceae bacterium]